MAKRNGSVAAVAALAASAVVWLLPGSATAQPVVASDRPAGLVMYPKIVSDPFALFTFGTGPRTETAIQITNTSTSTRVVHCFYVDATSHCSNNTNTFDPEAGTCRTTADCNLGGVCQPGWSEADFTFVMSPGQPLGWNASEGLQVGPGSPLFLGNIKAVPENYFVGELKCFEVDGTTIVGPGTGTTFTPIPQNDLKGEATIYNAQSGQSPTAFVDVRGYNAVGVQAVTGSSQPQPTDGTFVL